MTAAGKLDQFPKKIRYVPENANKIIDAFEGFEAAHPADSWLRQIRRSGLTQIETEGLPTPKLERWKFTKLPSFDEVPLVLRPQFTCSGDTSCFSSLKDCIPSEWVQTLLKQDFPAQNVDGQLWALNQAFLAWGGIVHLERGQTLDEPLNLYFRDVPHMSERFTLTAPRFIIYLEEGAEAEIVEYHESTGRGWRNACYQIVLEKNARLRHYRIQEDGDERINTSLMHLCLGQDSSYESFACNAGAQLARHQIHAELQAPNVTCSFSGTQLIDGAKLCDTTLTVEHKAPHCRSDQLYKSALTNQGHGVFQGKIHVHRAAQDTDAYQLSNAQLLSDKARMDTKPELEIYADNVRCSHGATSGQMDENPLFYLRSRGIPEDEARRLVIQAFLGEALETISSEAFKETIQSKIETWLRSHI